MGIEEMRARLSELKSTKIALRPEVNEEAEIAKEIVAEERRINEEGQAALAKFAATCEARVISAMPEDRRSRAIVRCIYDWPTHKRTMEGNDIETGRGVIVVTAPDANSAAKAVRKRNRVSSGTAEFADMDPTTVNAMLMKVTLYPAPDVLQQMLVESEPMCQAAYQYAMSLSGALALELSGKSES